VSVFSTACNSASIISIVSNVGWVADDSYVVLGKRFHGEKGSVRRWVVVMQLPVLLPPKFGAKSSHIFTQSPQNVHSRMRNWLFGLPGRILYEQFHWCQRSEHVIDFALHLSRFFSVSVRLNFPCTAHAFFLLTLV
jgi:hypothetical protein